MVETESTVLLVDADDQHSQQLRQWLNELSYDYDTVVNGAQAWELLLQNSRRYSAVIVNAELADMTGYELLKRIKHFPILSMLPVIIQTEPTSEQEYLNFLRAGAYYYLIKPISKADFIALIQAAIHDWWQTKVSRSELYKGIQSMKLMHAAEFKLRTLEECKDVAAYIANACPHPDKVVIGLSEMILNGIEHGNLGITYDEKSILIANNTWIDEIHRRLQLAENQQKYVKVTFQRSEQAIRITIEDQGPGFDWREYQDLDASRITHPHGRGIAMARLLSFTSVEYRENGRLVECTVEL